jgi:hypothetical protein
MNQKQMKVLWAGLVIIVLMALFPPWKYVFYVPGKLRIDKTGPYGLVFSPPEIPVTSQGYGDEFFEGRSRSMWAVQVDWHRLVLPVCAVAVLTFALTLTFRVRGSSKE